MEDPTLYLNFGKDLYRLEMERIEFPADIDPDRIISGSSISSISQSIGLILSGKTGFSNDETGYILGNDEGVQKFYIGTDSDYFNFDGTDVVISGTLTAGAIDIGSGANSFHVDSTGNTWWGAVAIGDAVAKVLKTGIATFTKITISGGSNVTFISDTLNTSTKTILKDFTFEDTDFAGNLKTGDITWSTEDGSVTGGSGILINAAGLIGANDGNTTFSIDATTGNATFAGAVTGATITGGTFKTAVATNQRIYIASNVFQSFAANRDDDRFGIEITSEKIWVCDDSGAASIRRMGLFHIGGIGAITINNDSEETLENYFFTGNSFYASATGGGTSLGTVSKPWNTIYGTTLYGDGSNLTGINPTYAVGLQDLWNDNDIEYSDASVAGAYETVKTVRLDRAGAVKITFELRTETREAPWPEAYVKIYKGGTAVGTLRSNAYEEWESYTEDISGFAAGDYINIKAATSTSDGSHRAMVRNFKVEVENYIDTVREPRSNDHWDTRTKDIVYQATVDGIIVVNATTGAGGGDVRGYTDDSTPPTTLRCRDYIQKAYHTYGGFTMPVKKGDYYEINETFSVGSLITNIWWFPLH